MRPEYPILEEMFRSFAKMFDLLSASLGRARQEGGDDPVPEEAARERSETPVEESAGDVPRRFADFLAEAAKGNADASLPADPMPAEVVRPHRTWKAPEGIAEDPGTAPSADVAAAEPLSLGEFPPELSWYPALILPKNKWGAQARQVARWLEAKTAAPAQAKDADKV